LLGDTFERWYTLFELFALDLAAARMAELVGPAAPARFRPIARAFIERWPHGPGSVPPRQRKAAVAATLAAIDAAKPGASSELHRLINMDFAVMPDEFVTERALAEALWGVVFRDSSRYEPLPNAVRERVRRVAKGHLDPSLWADLDVSSVAEMTAWDRSRVQELEERLALPPDLNPITEPLLATLMVQAVRASLSELREEVGPSEWSEFLQWVRSVVPATEDNASVQRLVGDVRDNPRLQTWRAPVRDREAHQG
jgi:hypothetical protein